MNEADLYDTIFRRIAIPMFALSVDARGELVFRSLNVAFEDVTGLREGDVVGKRLEDVPDLLGEDAAALQAYCRRCLEASEIVMCDVAIGSDRRGTFAAVVAQPGARRGGQDRPRRRLAGRHPALPAGPRCRSR